MPSVGQQQINYLFTKLLNQKQKEKVFKEYFLRYITFISNLTDAFDTRPISIWPFSPRITSLTYDSKHEHLAVALQSGNVCIIERTSGVNDLPFIQHVSPYPLVDIHAIDAFENNFNNENQDRQNGFFVLSLDGKIYRIKFQSFLSEDKTNEQQILSPSFPQYTIFQLMFKKKIICILENRVKILQKFNE